MTMHKRMLFNILIAMVLLPGSIFGRGSNQYSRKTYLAIRPHGINTAMECTTWHQHPYKPHEPTIRTHLQAVPFYLRSQRGAEIGKYFGVGNGKNSFRVSIPADVTAGTADIDKGFLIHDNANLNAGLRGTVSISPYQEAFGVRLDLFQDINHPFANLFFKASTPIEHVAHDVKLHVSDQVKSATAVIAAFGLEDFFKGGVSVVTPDPSMQLPLTKAKIYNKRSESGLADLDLALGYKYIHEEKKHVYLSLDLTIPTGNKVRGDYLFEPVYGNGHHVGLGASIDTGIELWNSEKANLDLLWNIRYKYLFEGTETRTLGLKDYKLGHYYLAGRIRQPANTALFPAANILTQPLTVKPGSQVDSMIDFAFVSNKFTVDVGYNLFWKDRESVHIKSFEDDKYGIATTIMNTGLPMDAGATLIQLNQSTISIDSVKTPALFTHKVFAGFGYTFNFYHKYLCSTGLGSSYEFSTSNADLENFAVWGKLNFSF